MMITRWQIQARFGHKQAAIEVELAAADLAALNDAWARLARAQGQEAWAEALEPHIVSGTPRWTVHRVVLNRIAASAARRSEAAFPSGCARDPGVHHAEGNMTGRGDAGDGHPDPVTDEGRGGG